MLATGATPFKSEIHSQIQTMRATYKVTPTIAKIIQINPQFILGESNLFTYDSSNQLLVPSPSFQELVKLLVELNELDSKALQASSLNELNDILQKPQGEQGGLMRKEGTERWDLQDNSTKKDYRLQFVHLFQKLGFVSPKSVEAPITVDQCIIFGGLAERVEKRIKATVKYLRKNLQVKDQIALLSSNRKLIPEEINLLKSKIEKLEEDQKKYWTELLNDPEQCIEANSVELLWKCIVPQELQTQLKKN